MQNAGVASLSNLFGCPWSLRPRSGLPAARSVPPPNFGRDEHRGSRYPQDRPARTPHHSSSDTSHHNCSCRFLITSLLLPNRPNHSGPWLSFLRSICPLSQLILLMAGWVGGRRRRPELATALLCDGRRVGKIHKSSPSHLAPFIP